MESLYLIGSYYPQNTMGHTVFLHYNYRMRIKGNALVGVYDKGKICSPQCC